MVFLSVRGRVASSLAARVSRTPVRCAGENHVRERRPTALSIASLRSATRKDQRIERPHRYLARNGALEGETESVCRGFALPQKTEKARRTGPFIANTCWGTWTRTKNN